MKRIFLVFFILLQGILMCSLWQNALFAQTKYEVEDDAVKKDTGEEGLVSLDFKDADLKDVLKVFSQQSGLNFIAAKEIEDSKITLYMNEVLVEDALKTLLEANNLGLAQSPGSNIIIVKGIPVRAVETVTRVYKIRYYHGNSTPGKFVFGKSTSGEESSGDKGKGGGGWKQILTPLLSKYGVIVNYSNLLIITDIASSFKLVDQVISEVDRPIPEVMIEVELIETTADFLKDIGVKWTKEMARYSGPSAATPFPFTPWEDKHNFGPTTTLTLPATGDFSYGLISSSALSWIIEMLQTDTNTKFLSKPRILVQDREWAEIKITANQVVSVRTIVDENNTTYEVERLEVGTILRLIPMINQEEGFISMLLEPSISRPVDSAFTDDKGTNFIDPQERSMRTVVMARDKETIAIGGFITTVDEETKTKVPWLGDIPLFGALFRHNSSNRIDKELLIFITPKLVNPSEKIDMWIQDMDTSGPQAKEQEQVKAKPEQKQEKTQAPASVLAPKEVKKELPFREQEDIAGDMNLDLTLKSSSLGVVDLVK